jgi:hypothetical protein
MRSLGVRGLFVTCLHCGYHTVVNVDAWPDDVPVPHGRIILTTANESLNPSKPPTRAAGLTIAGRRKIAETDGRPAGC